MKDPVNTARCISVTVFTSPCDTVSSYELCLFEMTRVKVALTETLTRAATLGESSTCLIYLLYTS